MAASNSPSIRELALAALARQRGGGETPRETAMRQGVSQPASVSTPRETPFTESNHTPNTIVSLSHHLGRETVRHRENRETPRETAVRQPGGSPYAEALDQLEHECPDYVETERWRNTVADGRRFLAEWGEKAAALGWTSRDLFGLAPIPDKPKPSFERLSRYDLTGLIWLLDGRPVIAMTDSSAAIETAGGGTLTYRRYNKPALGPLGDSLDDMEACR